MTSIAERLRVGQCRGLCILRRDGRLEASGGEHFFDGRDQPAQHVALAKDVATGMADSLFRDRRIPGRDLKGDRHDGLELEKVRYVVDEGERLAGMQEADCR